MARLLLEDVTLRREEKIIVQLRFKGGAIQQLQLPLPKAAWALRKTKLEIVAEIDRLLDGHKEAEVAHLLNECGWCSSAGNPFTRIIVHTLRRSHRLKTRFARLQAQGLLTPRQIGPMIGSATSRVNYWRQVGVLKAIKFGGENKYLYYRPTENEVNQIRQRRYIRSPKTKVIEAHHEAQ
jgi:hypothetical protein